jgi:hypothetical protein
MKKFIVKLALNFCNLTQNGNDMGSIPLNDDIVRKRKSEWGRERGAQSNQASEQGAQATKRVSKVRKQPSEWARCASNQASEQGAQATKWVSEVRKQASEWVRCASEWASELLIV